MCVIEIAELCTTFIILDIRSLHFFLPGSPHGYRHGRAPASGWPSLHTGSVPQLLCRPAAAWLPNAPASCEHHAINA